MKTIPLRDLFASFPATQTVLGRAAESPEAHAGNSSQVGLQAAAAVLDIVAQGNANIQVDAEKVAADLRETAKEMGAGQARDMRRLAAFIEQY